MASGPSIRPNQAVLTFLFDGDVFYCKAHIHFTHETVFYYKTLDFYVNCKFLALPE